MAKQGLEEILKSVSEVVSKPQSPGVKIQAILEKVSTYLELEGFHIIRIEEPVCFAEYSSYPSAPEAMPLKEFYVCSSAWRRETTLHYTTIPEEFKERLVKSDLKVRTYIGKQFKVMGKPYGVICFYSEEKRDEKFSASEVNLFDIISDWIGALYSECKQISISKNQISDLTDKESFLKSEFIAFKRVFRMVPSNMMIVDEKGIIETVTDSCCRFFEKRFDDLVGKPKEKLAEIPDVVFENKKSHCVFHYSDKVKKDMKILVTCNEIEDSFSKKYVLTFTDKTVEEQVKGTNLIYEEIINTTPDLIAVADTEHNLLFYNNSYGEFHGIDENSKTNISKLQTSESYSLLRDVGIPTALEKGAWRGVTERCALSGEKMLVDQTIISFIDPLSGNVLLATLMRDVSKEKKYEKKLEITAAELQRKNRDLEQFAHIVSHDIKAPLRHLDNKVKKINMISQGQLEQNITDVAHSMTTSVDRIRGLVDGIFKLSVASKRDFSKELFSVDEMLRSIEDEEAGRLSPKPEFIFKDMPSINADKTLTRQVFQNLINNSLKYSHPQRPPRIEINCRELPQSWEFSVKDNGVGIDGDSKEIIFEPFTRLMKKLDVPGSGMGLAICRRIVEKQRGEIKVSSSPLGTEISFTVMRQDSEPVDNKRV